MHYVCSDIHGQYELYKRMKADLQLGEGDVLYILGDLLDRGPEIFPLFLDVMEDPNVVCLLGNHEWLMADYAAGDTQSGRWFKPANSGSVTWGQFKALSEETQQKIMDFIHSRPLQLEVEAGGVTFLLSHSYFLADKGTVLWKDVPDGQVYDTVWNSPWREKQHVEFEDYLKDGRTHVIGHVPVQYFAEPVEGPEGPVMTAADLPEYHLVNIDLGCARIPRKDGAIGLGLCCMCLEDYAAGRDAFRYYRAKRRLSLKQWGKKSVRKLFHKGQKK